MLLIANNPQHIAQIALEILTPFSLDAIALVDHTIVHITYIIVEIFI